MCVLNHRYLKQIVVTPIYALHIFTTDIHRTIPIFLKLITALFKMQSINFNPHPSVDRLRCTMATPIGRVVCANKLITQFSNYKFEATRNAFADKLSHDRPQSNFNVIYDAPDPKGTHNIGSIVASAASMFAFSVFGPPGRNSAGQSIWPNWMRFYIYVYIFIICMRCQPIHTKRRGAEQTIGERPSVNRAFMLLLLLPCKDRRRGGSSSHLRSAFAHPIRLWSHYPNNSITNIHTHTHVSGLIKDTISLADPSCHHTETQRALSPLGVIKN